MPFSSAEAVSFLAGGGKDEVGLKQSGGFGVG